MSPLVYWRRMIRHVSLLTWVGVRSGLEHRIALAQPVLRLLRALAGHARVEADLHPGIKQNDTYYARRVHVVREKRHTHNSYSFSLASSPWPRRADCSAPTGPSLHRDGGDRGKGEIYLILLPYSYHSIPTRTPQTPQQLLLLTQQRHLQLLVDLLAVPVEVKSGDLRNGRGEEGGRVLATGLRRPSPHGCSSYGSITAETQLSTGCTLATILYREGLFITAETQLSTGGPLTIVFNHGILIYYGWHTSINGGNTNHSVGLL